MIDKIKIEERKETLKKIAKGEFKEILNILNDFEKAINNKDRNNMLKISKSAFNLEKKYIPQIPENQNLANKLKCDTLIMTIGFQKEPIILSILCLKPKEIFLLHTEGSHRIAGEVRDDEDVDKLNSDIHFCEITESNAVENYKIIQEKILTRAKGNIIVDPTAGRKIMVASLALSAFYFNLPMVYMHSVEVDGIVYPFTETLEYIQNPFEYFGDIELKIVEDQFNSHFYKSAMITCEEIIKKTRDPATAKKIELIKDLIKIYMEWDKFYHSEVPQKKPILSERLKNIKEEFERFNFEKLLPENIDNNIEFLEEIDKGYKRNLNIIDEYRIVDVYLGALRKGTMKQGYYDDAVARLYRVIEMCSSYILLKYGIKDLSQPDWNEFCQKINKDLNTLNNEFKNKTGKDLPNENLGLDVQMIILSLINDKNAQQIYRIYNAIKKEKSGERSLMEKRNRSILAHGTDPIQEEDWVKFREKVKVIIQNTIGYDKFDELLKKGYHGKIKLS